jgi:O-acetyl-ADP-ribose deacetylase (regulator of RNase III)
MPTRFHPGDIRLRSNASTKAPSVVVHGGIDYPVVLRAGMDYRLDCAPVRENENTVAENHFSFVEEARLSAD